jgi:hypothetical protein
VETCTGGSLPTQSFSCLSDCLQRPLVVARDLARLPPPARAQPLPVAFQDIRLSPKEQDFQPLGEWAKRLAIPARTLLHHASQGSLRLFTLPSPDVDYYSVHEDFVGNAADPMPYEAQPISMPEPGVMGLVLASDDCAQLAAHGKVAQPFFRSIIRKQGIWGNIIEPISGRPRSTIRPNGWRIAAYKRMNSGNGEWNAHSPVAAGITPFNVYARDVDIEAFLTGLKTYQFVIPLFQDDHIAEELPKYVSGKLRELFFANRIFWRDATTTDVPERERRRAELKKYLKQEFLEYCDKKSKPESLLAFAADACDPMALPQSQRFHSTSVTPAMLTLLTASKLYWSAHCELGQGHDTYPDQKALLSFLQFMGLQGNTAVSGRTLIRPEGLGTPEPAPDPLSRLLARRQGLKR